RCRRHRRYPGPKNELRCRCAPLYCFLCSWPVRARRFASPLTGGPRSSLTGSHTSGGGSGGCWSGPATYVCVNSEPGITLPAASSRHVLTVCSPGTAAPAGLSQAYSPGPSERNVSVVSVPSSCALRPGASAPESLNQNAMYGISSRTIGGPFGWSTYTGRSILLG